MRIITRTILALLLTSTTFAVAQTAPVAGASTEPQAKPVTLEYTLYRLENGKRVKPESFKMRLHSNESGRIKKGTRVPVTKENARLSDTQAKFIDVGMVIDSSIKMREGQMHLAATIDMRGIEPDPSGQGVTPVVRSNKVESNVVVTLGRAMLLASIDDPLTKQTCDIEVKVTQD